MKRVFLGVSLPLALVMLAVGAVGCPPQPVQPAPDADADVTDDAHRKTSCDASCTSLRAKGCQEGFSLDGGDSCESVCQHTVASGVYDWKPGCTATTLKK